MLNTVQSTPEYVKADFVLIPEGDMIMSLLRLCALDGVSSSRIKTRYNFQDLKEKFYGEHLSSNSCALFHQMAVRFWSRKFNHFKFKGMKMLAC